MSPEIVHALQAFGPLLPNDTVLTIDENSCRFGQRYIYRLLYRSMTSGRSMAMVAKSDYLPTQECDDLWFILRQLQLTPKEVSIEFARIYWREKNARGSEWLSAGKLSNIRVSDKVAHQDRTMTYGELTGV